MNAWSSLRTTFLAAVTFCLDEFIHAISKNEIWFKVKEEVKRQPEEYMEYFEDWLFTSDAEIGPYCFFETA